MRGPRSICRAPAGSASIRPRACSPAKATSRSPARRTPSARRRSRARIEECETTFEHAMSVRRVVESPRVTKPYSDEQWRAVDAFGRRIERQLDGRRRARHDRRRADVRRDGRPRCARVEYGRERADQAPVRDRLDRAAARALRAARPAALRAGQVVSRRAVAALGVQSVLAPRRQGCCGATAS